MPLHVEEEEVDPNLKDALRDCVSELRNLRELHMDVVTGAHFSNCPPPFEPACVLSDTADAVLGFLP